MPYHLKFRIRKDERTGWFVVEMKESGFFESLRRWLPTYHSFELLADAETKKKEFEQDYA